MMKRMRRSEMNPVSIRKQIHAKHAEGQIDISVPHGHALTKRQGWGFVRIAGIQETLESLLALSLSVQKREKAIVLSILWACLAVMLLVFALSRSGIKMIGTAAAAAIQLLSFSSLPHHSLSSDDLLPLGELMRIQSVAAARASMVGKALMGFCHGNLPFFPTCSYI